MAGIQPAAGIIGLFMFVGGIGLMAVSDGIGFGVGLLFFIIGLVIGITMVMWGIAGTADRALNKLTGDSDE